MKKIKKILMVLLAVTMFPFNTAAYYLCNIFKVKGRENMTSPSEGWALLCEYLNEEK